jgi:hypothetical protein
LWHEQYTLANWLLGWHWEQAIRCHPSMPVLPWLNVVGVQPAWVWHWAQFVRSPWLLPWQLVQATPGELMPFTWQREQAKRVCTPASLNGCEKLDANDVIVWHLRQAP